MHTRMDALACRMHVGEAIGDTEDSILFFLALVLVSKAYF